MGASQIDRLVESLRRVECRLTDRARYEQKFIFEMPAAPIDPWRRMLGRGGSTLGASSHIAGTDEVFAHKRPGSMQTTLDSRRLLIQRAGDFGDGLLLEIAEQDHLTVMGR